MAIGDEGAQQKNPNWAGANPGSNNAYTPRGNVKSGMGAFFQGQYEYAWYLLTEEEKLAYAQWHETGAAGAFNVDVGGAVMPKNWKLLEEGSVAGVADKDVGVVGLHYLAHAGDVMKGGGTMEVVNQWRSALRAKGLLNEQQ